MNETCSTHSPEAIHVFTFHLYWVCCENFGHEHWRKIRSEIGDEEILPRFLELGQVFYMSEFVSWCSTLFVLWVFAKSQGIRICVGQEEARVFVSNRLLEVEDKVDLGWAWVNLLLAPSFSIYTPWPIVWYFIHFWFFFLFDSDLLFFAQI